MVVIIGTGIVGASTAYYLSTLGSERVGPIILLDAVGPAAASSGKAGAFITNRPPSFRRGIGKNNDTGNDKRRTSFEKSFELHRELAKDLDLESFCRVQSYQSVDSEKDDCNNDGNCFDGSVDTDDESVSGENVQLKYNKQHTALQTLAENGRGIQLPGDAALVDPAEIVFSMMDKILSQSDCSFRRATVSGLEVDPSGSCVKAIHCEGDVPGKIIRVEEDEPVVITLGPWSCRIEDWLEIPMPIEGVLSTSLVFEDEIPAPDVGTAFFFDDDSNGCHLEIFGRRDKSLYVSGCGESKVISTRSLRSHERPSPAVPCSPDLARAAAAKASLLKAGYDLLDTSTDSDEKHRAQACMRPASPDGTPIVGKILDNVYVATGGGPWGITWGPLMGKSIACLISDDDDEPIRIGTLSPQRFETLVYKTLMKSRSPNDL